MMSAGLLSHQTLRFITHIHLENSDISFPCYRPEHCFSIICSIGDKPYPDSSHGDMPTDIPI